MKLKMYFLMLALGVCGAAMQSCDDDDDNLKVPEKLQSAFSQKYPEASPKWKTRGNYYIADFQDQNYESEAWFTFDAVWLMTETDLPYAALPEAVKNAFQNSEYRSWRPDDVDMIERESMEPVYVLEVEQGSREMDLYYNAEGILTGNTDSLRWISSTTELPRRCFLTTTEIGFPHPGRSVRILFRKPLKLRSSRQLTIIMSVMKPTMSREW